MSKAKVINPELEKFLNKLMKEAMSAHTEMSLTDKMKIADRVLKFEALKQKVTDDGFGSAFQDHEDDD